MWWEVDPGPLRGAQGQASFSVPSPISEPSGSCQTPGSRRTRRQAVVGPASCLPRGSVPHFTSALRRDTSCVPDHPRMIPSSERRPLMVTGAGGQALGSLGTRPLSLCREPRPQALPPGRGCPALPWKPLSADCLLPRLTSVREELRGGESLSSDLPLPCVGTAPLGKSLHSPEQQGTTTHRPPALSCAPALGRRAHACLGSVLPFFRFVPLPPQASNQLAVHRILVDLHACSNKNIWTASTPLSPAFFSSPRQNQALSSLSVGLYKSISLHQKSRAT